MPPKKSLNKRKYALILFYSGLLGLSPSISASKEE